MQGCLIFLLKILSWHPHDRCLPLEGAGDWQIVPRGGCLSAVPRGRWLLPAGHPTLGLLGGSLQYQLTYWKPVSLIWPLSACLTRKSADAVSAQIEHRGSSLFFVVFMKRMPWEIRVGIFGSSVTVENRPGLRNWKKRTVFLKSPKLSLKRRLVTLSLVSWASPWLSGLIVLPLETCTYFVCCVHFCFSFILRSRTFLRISLYSVNFKVRKQLLHNVIS